MDARVRGDAPELVFNCAAFHNVDECEREPDRAWAVNVRAVRELAQLCGRHGAKLVHLSTNYVFDGRRAEPYGEDDLPSPRSVYALTKLAGEHAALAYAPGALVVRTAGLYGLAGSASKGGNFVQRMIGARARDGDALQMVADQRLQPTFTADLAEAILDGRRARRGRRRAPRRPPASARGSSSPQAIMDERGARRARSSRSRRRSGRAASTGRSTACSRARARRLGLAPLRPLARRARGLHGPRRGLAWR